MKVNKILLEAQNETAELFNSGNDADRRYGFGALTMWNVWVKEVRKLGLEKEFGIEKE